MAVWNPAVTGLDMLDRSGEAYSGADRRWGGKRTLSNP